MSTPNKAYPAKGYMFLGILGLLTLVGGFGGWSVFANISGAIIASGQVEVDQNRQVVQHTDGGIVASISVNEGDFVTEGDVVVRLDDTILRSELAITESQLFEIWARKARLETERDGLPEVFYPAELLEEAAIRPEVQNLLDGQSRLFEARATSLRQQNDQLLKRRDQISTQVEGIDAQKAALERQLELIKEELADQQSLLDRGLAQAARVLNLQREEASLNGRRGELIASGAQAEERATEIDIEILRVETARREEAITQLRDLQVRALELEERRNAVETRLNRLDIRAPVSGIVYSKQIFGPQSVIRPAEPVMYLVPQDRPLVVAAQVEPIHVDQVFVGQEVIVRFSSFDARTTPELFGQVLQVSADAFTDERTQATYYRAEIRLPEEEIAKLPEGLVMIPGMPVETFIRTDERSPLVYLVKPLTDYFAKAFRES